MCDAVVCQEVDLNRGLLRNEATRKKSFVLVKK